MSVSQSEANMLRGRQRSGDEMIIVESTDSIQSYNKTLATHHRDVITIIIRLFILYGKSRVICTLTLLKLTWPSTTDQGNAFCSILA